METYSKAQLKIYRSLKLKKFRDELGLFLAEGQKCVDELRKAFELEAMLTVDNIGQTAIEQLSSLRTPQGVIAVFRKPQAEEHTNLPDNRGLVLALDGVQDPGNVGTIIRTCDWYGVRDIYCSQDTADCYSPKVVQATMGALSRVRVHYVNLPEWLKQQAQIAPEMPIYGTLLDGRNMYDDGAIVSSKESGVGSAVIVMGNEGNGISAEVRQIITHPLFIPSYPQNEATSESLNVAIATAVVLSEFRRRENCKK